MRLAVANVRKTHKVVGIYHDVSDLSSADNDYVAAFATLAKELGKNDFVYVATIPKNRRAISPRPASSCPCSCRPSPNF